MINYEYWYKINIHLIYPTVFRNGLYLSYAFGSKFDLKSNYAQFDTAYFRVHLNDVTPLVSFTQEVNLW